MADVTITPTEALRLVQGTMSPDLNDTLANYMQQITTGQTFEVNIHSDERGLVFVLYDSGGSAATWTFNAGAYPPSALKDKGAKTFTPAASDFRPLVLEHGRHMQVDGKITGSVSGGTVKLGVLRLPRGA